MLPYLDDISSPAKLMGAVNTVVNVNNRLRGENTDGKGFLRSLVDDAGVNPSDKRIVLWDHDYFVPADCDVLVNATSIGQYPDIHSKPGLVYGSILDSMVVCDVIPNPRQTHFLLEAQLRGARTLDGLGMLVYQGAIGFKLWTGLDAPIPTMREALEEALDVKCSFLDKRKLV